jgi:DNA-binding Lrp family transcriptional regulator
MSLDKIDERIVGALIEDARASYATIGALVGLSAPAVKRRVDRLQESGAIRGFTARVDPVALGWTTEAYVELFCRALTSPADIRAAVRRYPEVVGACTVTGEADALLHIQAADVGHFEQVVERIRAEPFTTRTRSVIVMSRLVDRTGGPVPSAEGESARLPRGSPALQPRPGRRARCGPRGRCGRNRVRVRSGLAERRTEHPGVPAGTGRPRSPPRAGHRDTRRPEAIRTAKVTSQNVRRPPDAAPSKAPRAHRCAVLRHRA